MQLCWRHWLRSKQNAHKRMQHKLAQRSLPLSNCRRNTRSRWRRSCSSNGMFFSSYFFFFLKKIFCLLWCVHVCVCVCVFVCVKHKYVQQMAPFIFCMMLCLCLCVCESVWECALECLSRLRRYTHFYFSHNAQKYYIKTLFCFPQIYVRTLILEYIYYYDSPQWHTANLLFVTYLIWKIGLRVIKCSPSRKWPWTLVCFWRWEKNTHSNKTPHNSGSVAISFSVPLISHEKV